MLHMSDWHIPTTTCSSVLISQTIDHIFPMSIGEGVLEIYSYVSKEKESFGLIDWKGAAIHEEVNFL